MTTSNGNDATPGSRKRSQPMSDDQPAPSPTSTKKRKLNGAGDGPSSPAPRGFNAIASAISNAFGYNQKPQGSPNGASAPAKGGTQSAAGTPTKPRPAIKLAALKGTIWDNDDRPRLSPSPKKTPTSAKSSKSRTSGTPGNARTPSRPTNGSPLKPRSTGKPRATDSEREPEVQDIETDAEARGTPSSAKKQMPAKRLWGSGAPSPAPKGILSPSKNRNQTPKNVKFDKQAGGEMFFEDLPTSKKKTPAPRKTKEKPVDEILCGICSKAHSKRPNQIILCDNCDYAVHQECYGVPEIPEGDWLCRSCAQEDVVVNTPKKDVAPAVPEAPVKPVDMPDIPNLDRHLRSVQRVLLDRCSGRRRIDMFGLQEVQGKARQVVEQTVVAGEGNSMLLIGARGSGKTTLLESVISEVSDQHGQDFHVVRLNGFIHTDDKLALKEIWRQLGKEMDVEDDLVNRTNYADTMASLLALLSHPSEILGADEGVTSQSIIFIIDEFDMFATHPRQTLLYNLFDVAQSRKAPIAVLGCTARLNVVEMLEKRVKSRFSHRYVYLTLPKTLPAYWQVCRQGLIVERKDAEREGIDTNLEGYSEFQKYWSAKIDELYKQHPFQELLQYHYYTTKSTAAFFNEWIMPLASLSSSNMTLSVPSIGSEATSLTPPDSRMHLLSTLSDLDLGLLIAAARLDIVAHTDTINFAMAYDEYTALVGRQRVQSSASGLLAMGVRVWSRGVAGISWERLISLGLLVPAGVGAGRGMGYGGLEGRMWKVDVALEEIPLATKLSSVLAKWCKEI